MSEPTGGGTTPSNPNHHPQTIDLVSVVSRCRREAVAEWYPLHDNVIAKSGQFADDRRIGGHGPIAAYEQTAPVAADPTSLVYFASTPVL